MGTENVPKQDQQDQAGSQLDVAQVEYITRIVLQVIELHQEQEINRHQSNQAGRVARMVNAVFSKGVTIPILLLATITVVGLFMFDIPLTEVPKVAAEKYRQAHLTSELVDHHVALGESFLDIGRARSAKAEFDKALELDAANPDAHRGSFKSELFTPIQEGAYDPAVTQERLDQFLEETRRDGSDGDDATASHAYAYLGDILSRTNPEEALDYYRQAITLRSTNSHAHFGKGNTYRNQAAGMSNTYKIRNKLEQAKKEYKAAANLARDEHVGSGDVFAYVSQEYQHNYAYILYKLKRYQEAGEAERALLSWDPYYVPGYYVLPQYYQLGWGDLKTSLKYQKELISLLKDEKIMAQERNSLTTYSTFDVDSESVPVFLPELPDHKYYIYYSTALTSYLLGNVEAAEGYIETARKLQANGQVDDYLVPEVKRLMEFDIETLIGARPDFKPKAEEFRQKFL